RRRPGLRRSRRNREPRPVHRVQGPRRPPRRVPRLRLSREFRPSTVRGRLARIYQSFDRKQSPNVTPKPAPWRRGDWGMRRQNRGDPYPPTATVKRWRVMGVVLAAAALTATACGNRSSGKDLNALLKNGQPTPATEAAPGTPAAPADNSAAPSGSAAPAAGTDTGSAAPASALRRRRVRPPLRPGPTPAAPPRRRRRPPPQAPLRAGRSRRAPLAPPRLRRRGRRPARRRPRVPRPVQCPVPLRAATPPGPRRRGRSVGE